MEFKTFQKYFFNCFLLTIPVLLWDYAFTDRLPQVFQAENFSKGIPSFIINIENGSRLLMFIFISLIPIEMLKPIQKKGLVLYVIGTLLYFASWLMLMYFPNSTWSKSALGLLSPAYTPLFWLVGIGLIGDSLYFNIPYRRWWYFFIVIVFLIFHNWHTYLIYLKIE
ncbi:hypothetical protein [Haliscomenobacter sp.]|uniref:hypothetical protein n=1 Tax=Haliscomenobacter sp. TaxID=2717303 RepID=UPI003594947B